MPIALLAVASTALLATAYLAGAYSYSRDIWPMKQLRLAKKQLQVIDADQLALDASQGPDFDEFYRLIDFPVAKEQVDCPPQGPRTAVLLLIGQSNAANFHGQRHSSAHGKRVVNYFAGRCYVAASPLLGAAGDMGESWTLLGNKLVAAGLADMVILVPAAIGGSQIARWQAAGDLNTMMLTLLSEVSEKYRVTGVLWHQGENDRPQTSAYEYRQRFLSLVDSLRSHGVDAPIFVSVATRCRNYSDWYDENPVNSAQRSLTDAAAGIYAGVDTDTLLELNDRYDDCHFSGTGQEKFANAWVEILAAHNAGTPGKVSTH